MHFIKYNLIGLINTGLTLGVVFVLHQLWGMPVFWANLLGYVIGGVNSYILNRIWNFKSQNRKREEVLRFVVVFGVSYALNVAVLESSLWLFTHWTPIFAWVAWWEHWFEVGFQAHVVANVAYVVASYGLYRYWVFREQRSD